MEKRIFLSDLQVAALQRLGAAQAAAQERLTTYTTAIVNGADMDDVQIKGMDGNDLIVEVPEADG